MEKYDFSGWATKNDLKCSDGRTIRAGAFAHMDGVTVPLMWQHGHDNPEHVLGHALLEARANGVYAYCSFNETSSGQRGKELVQHRDITQLSIYANKLTHSGRDVVHGDIKEVSLVLSGANPGAQIESVVLQHADGSVEEEAVIYTGLGVDYLEHSDNDNEGADMADKTVKDVFETLNEEQKNVVYFMIGQALEGQSAEHSDDLDNEDDGTLQHANGKETIIVRNVFENHGASEEAQTLSHDQLKTIWEDAKKPGTTLRDSFLAHADEYGITNIDMLFPDAKAISNTPEWIKRRTEWVDGIINGAHHVPFSNIKSMSADITLDTARAKGYIKGTMKKEEFFAIAKRTTSAKTIYKKQKLDRDDIIDITDLDVVAWIKAEMRLMLDEEIARAILLGDGREVDDDDKIDETKIRPIAFDDQFYTHKIVIASNVDKEALVEAVLRSRKFYKGSNPAFYTTEDVFTDMLLAKDKMGRRLYPTVAELESALRVTKIVTVEVMESYPDLLGVMVNISDYTIGANQGGQISMFEDFDIDFNQEKYLIETRISGALTKAKTAIAYFRENGTEVSPEVPGFVPATGVITIPATVGVIYALDGVDVVAGAQAAIEAGETATVEARPAVGYAFPHNIDTDWDFTRPLA